MSQQAVPESERPWGRYEIILETASYKVKRVFVEPGHRLSLQRHKKRSEHWVIVRGKARVTKNKESLELAEGESTNIPNGSIHRIANAGDITLEFIEVQFGDYFGEDDIERLEDDYSRSGS